MSAYVIVMIVYPAVDWKARAEGHQLWLYLLKHSLDNSVFLKYYFHIYFRLLL